ncbi:alpha-ketoglutarate-dependent dioxygenase AlkB [Streptomyces sp. TS71-3]|uniref:alpha-ketoglutarate-dependent dioxygenase AlkB n=1 Tax=Streptomyces sp. TS71-3 TaxID=2733862 RepID=UPI001B2D5A65|nr:alpha-ketoglutarate-dependent dioxygenase AlkB [Streptomyces sp. TS71-3]GHJ35327.1 alkylated DNA repair protein [Streptomyces sp. TS71-3]
MSAVHPGHESPTGAGNPAAPPTRAGDSADPPARAGDPADRLGLQGSLFDQADDIALGPLDGVRRTVLGDGAWIDLLPGWLTGADALFEQLAEQVPWRAERRRMYDNTVAVPRLLAFYAETDPLPHPVLDEARAALTGRYAAELGEGFATAGLCLYRDGRDSVAWHGDRIGRGSREDTMVAILSVGTPRDLLLRPRGGGTSLRRPLGHGDLIVMGGSCQRTWEHAIPKSARASGPRISIQFRPHGVR